MPKFTLIAEHTDIYGKPMGHKVTHEFNVDGLDSVLENIDLFLRGIGFLPTGTLDYVEDEYNDGMNSTLEDYPEDTHSDFYFDKERNK